MSFYVHNMNKIEINYKTILFFRKNHAPGHPVTSYSHYCDFLGIFTKILDEALVAVYYYLMH